MPKICIKRVYENKSTKDGLRVLVDRIWPRGLKKEEAGIHLWLKEVAPSTALRQWFDHDVDKWPEFQKKYTVELKQSPSLEELRSVIKEHKAITLLYSAKDEAHNQAVVLKKVLEDQ